MAQALGSTTGQNGQGAPLGHLIFPYLNHTGFMIMRDTEPVSAQVPAQL